MSRQTGELKVVSLALTERDPGGEEGASAGCWRAEDSVGRGRCPA